MRICKYKNTVLFSRRWSTDTHTNLKATLAAQFFCTIVCRLPYIGHMTPAVWALCPSVMLHRSRGCDLLLLQVNSGVICSRCTAEYRPQAALWSCFKQTAQSQPLPSEVLKLLTCHIQGALGKSGNTHTTALLHLSDVYFLKSKNGKSLWNLGY